jgi:hypothetical protein
MAKTKNAHLVVNGQWKAWFSSHKSMGSGLRKALSALILGLSFSLVFVYLMRAWADIQMYPWRATFDGRSFSVAILALFCHFSVNVLAFRVLLRARGYVIETVVLFRICLLANMARYVPGKIWTVTGKGYLLARHGVNAAAATRAVLLEVVLTVTASLFVCFPLLGFVLPVKAPWSWLTLCAWLILPGLLGVRLIAGRVRRLAWLAEAGLPPTTLCIVFGLYALAWVVYGFSFWLLVRTLAPVSISFFPHALAATGNAWLAGVAVLLAPAGLGVRESVLLLLLKSWLPLGVAAVLALGARVWMTLGELLALGIVYILPARDGPNMAQSSKD